MDEFKTLIALVAIFGVVNIAFGIAALGGLSEQDVKDVVAGELETLEIPSAEEIASEVNVSAPEIEMPEFDDEKVGDIWKEAFATQISVLKGNASEDAFDAIEDEYEALEDFFEANVEDFDEFEFNESISIEDSEVKVLQLGLDENEDKEAKVLLELEVNYTKKGTPVDDVYEQDVLVTANVFYDEGLWNESEVELSYALA